ncbi:MAG: L-threonine 3-dehydrogenase, partial [Bacteroidales bacterium]|nr:L-threonine 3-dehydrogenase [Bacteroidales bacterium]
KIASTWPNWMDDSCARQEWDFNPNFDLDSMTQDMIKVLREKFGK